MPPGPSPERIATLFDALADLDADEAKRRLDDECAGDADLRAAVEQLLAHDRAAAGGFLAPRPALLVEILQEHSGPSAAAAEEEAEAETLLAGSILDGRYRIDRRIGAGGMGAVYSAYHLGLERSVALKVIAPRHMTDRGHVERFRREARITVHAKHPNIVEVLDLAQDADGRWYIAMELLEGMDLAEAIRLVGSYEPAAMATVLDGVLAALEHAHRLGLVHRDLKPRNIFLTRSASGEEVVKLLDFGVVKVMNEGAEVQLTRTGTVLGTPEFMAPEQIKAAPVDGRADLYAAGCVAYAMLCGNPPWASESIVTVLRGHTSQPPVPPSRLRPDLPAPKLVDGFVLRALEKDPARRFGSATAMRASLAVLTAGVSRRGPPARPALADGDGGDVSRTIFDDALVPAVDGQPAHGVERAGWSKRHLALAMATGAALAALMAWLLPHC